MFVFLILVHDTHYIKQYSPTTNGSVEHCPLRSNNVTNCKTTEFLAVELKKSLTLMKTEYQNRLKDCKEVKCPWKQMIASLFQCCREGLMAPVHDPKPTR